MKNQFSITFFFTILFLASIIKPIYSQKKRVLFLGNSYTGVNNLPQLVSSLSSSAGDTLLVDSNTPGGYTLQQHCTNSTSINKIKAGNWDFVVLQEQSQLPSFPTSQVERDMFPYAKILDSIIKRYNPCSETIFYMTWGRKNGDASNCPFWPPVCTYEGMDSLIAIRYMMMANRNNALVSPVGKLWQFMRRYNPLIELYQADQSHPSYAGSYAAACCFYSILFKKNPVNTSFNGSLSLPDATSIRNAAKLMVYDSLAKWNIGKYNPVARFSYSISNGNQVSFTSNSLFADSFTWDFGDGNISYSKSPINIFRYPGTYKIKLTAYHCGWKDSILQNVLITAVDTMPVQIILANGIYPNPVSSQLNVTNKDALAKQYRITDSRGALVKTGILQSQYNKIDVSVLQAGTYYIECYAGNKLYWSKQFVKFSHQ